MKNGKEDEEFDKVPITRGFARIALEGVLKFEPVKGHCS